MAHLALGMMGEGEMWDPTDKMFAPAASVLAKHGIFFWLRFAYFCLLKYVSSKSILSGLTPIELKAKEGLALINGTQFITSIGAVCLKD